MTDTAHRPPPRPNSFSRGWPALVVVVLVVVLVMLSVVVVAHPGPLSGEVAYIRWLQRRGEPTQSLARFVRATTGTDGCLALALLPGIWIIRRFGRAGIAAVSIALLALLVIQPVFKELVDRPRPDSTQVEVRAVHASKSYPSGHSLSTTTVWGAAAGIAWQRRRRALAVGAVVPIVLTGFASGVQGVHWPSDAIGGSLVGVLAATTIVRVLSPPSRGSSRSISGISSGA